MHRTKLTISLNTNTQHKHPTQTPNTNTQQIRNEDKMATKNNPGNYDCYQKADPDEPLFTLRAKDATAPMVVMFWVWLRLNDWIEEHGEGTPMPVDYEAKINEALSCSRAMKEWRAENV
jgi:hypothetical protein